MIFDVVLLALAEIASTQDSSIAIFLEMRIAQGDGIQISHPISGYELWLSGNVDYAVIEYEDVGDYKGEPNCHMSLLHELLHSLLRLLAHPWWIQRGCIQYFKRLLVPC
jgi:hypothetical protein